VLDTKPTLSSEAFPLEGRLQDIAVAGDGNELYVASESRNAIHVLDAMSGMLKTGVQTNLASYR
jgi:DNA-binding beta-propeller fold protein YncE